MRQHRAGPANHLDSKRLAYADPPYQGCCSRYGHRHEDPWGCWDEPRTHRELLIHLYANYEGWAFSLSSPSLIDLELLPIVRAAGGRIGAWVKPFAAFKANVRVAYAWEPVIFREARVSSKDGAAVTRDYLAEPITLQRGLTGAKPQRFNRWILDLMGYVEGDEVTDIFPGTGGLAKELAQGVLL
jgi:hypothetical protein